MFPLLIAVCSGVLAYELVTIFIMLGRKKRIEVENRMQELRSEKNDAQKPGRKIKRVRGVKRDGAAARTRKELEKLENQMYDAGLRIPVMQFLAIWAGLALGLPLLLPLIGVNVLIALGTAVVIAAAPILYIVISKKKRRQVLEGQLVEAISVLCNALRAGHSFQSAMQNIATEMTGPISDEFGRVFLETQHGMTMADSFDRMLERTGSEDLEMLCTAILIQRDIGGNLAEVLENISGTIQARLSLKAEIKTRTASGRLSGYIVGALPILLLAAMSAINPEYSQQLFSKSLGQIMLAIGGVMELIGFIVINKMVSIKY